MPLPLALVIPYHNEAQHLPRFIDSLRRQRGPGVPAVFVDNGSTDGSASLVARCEEVRGGRWICLTEPQVGKFFAMRTGATFCQERLRTPYVAFMDADSYPASADWLADCVAVAGGPAHVGYTYSPLRYFGFAHLPTFVAAYAAYESVTHDLMRRVGWLANGQAFLCASDVVERYFEAAQVTTEIDLRLSLLALSMGRTGVWNPAVMMTSARRIVLDARSFQAWCFYDPTYYSQKDINASDKRDLTAPAPDLPDLDASLLPRFFTRRATKLAARHFLPLLVFDRTHTFRSRLGWFGTDLADEIGRGLGTLSASVDCLLSNEFEALVTAIDRHSMCGALASHLAHAMRETYSKETSPLRTAPRRHLVRSAAALRRRH